MTQKNAEDDKKYVDSLKILFPSNGEVNYDGILQEFKGKLLSVALARSYVVKKFNDLYKNKKYNALKLYDMIIKFFQDGFNIIKNTNVIDTDNKLCLTLKVLLLISFQEKFQGNQLVEDSFSERLYDQLKYLFSSIVSAQFKKENEKLHLIRDIMIELMIHMSIKFGRVDNPINTNHLKELDEEELEKKEKLVLLHNEDNQKKFMQWRIDYLNARRNKLLKEKGEEEIKYIKISLVDYKKLYPEEENIKNEVGDKKVKSKKENEQNKKDQPKKKLEEKDNQNFKLNFKEKITDKQTQNQTNNQGKHNVIYESVNEDTERDNAQSSNRLDNDRQNQDNYYMKKNNDFQKNNFNNRKQNSQNNSQGLIQLSDDDPLEEQKGNQQQQQLYDNTKTQDNSLMFSYSQIPIKNYNQLNNQQNIPQQLDLSINDQQQNQQKQHQKQQQQYQQQFNQNKLDLYENNQLDGLNKPNSVSQNISYNNSHNNSVQIPLKNNNLSEQFIPQQNNNNQNQYNINIQKHSNDNSDLDHPQSNQNYNQNNNYNNQLNNYQQNNNIIQDSNNNSYNSLHKQNYNENNHSYNQNNSNNNLNVQNYSDRTNNRKQQSSDKKQIPQLNLTKNENNNKKTNQKKNNNNQSPQKRLSEIKLKAKQLGIKTLKQLMNLNIEDDKKWKLLSIEKQYSIVDKKSEYYKMTISELLNNQNPYHNIIVYSFYIRNDQFSEINDVSIGQYSISQDPQIEFNRAQIKISAASTEIINMAIKNFSYPITPIPVVLLIGNLVPIKHLTVYHSILKFVKSANDKKEYCKKNKLQQYNYITLEQYNSNLITNQDKKNNEYDQSRFYTESFIGKDISQKIGYFSLKLPFPVDNYNKDDILLFSLVIQIFEDNQLNIGITSFIHQNTNDGLSSEEELKLQYQILYTLAFIFGTKESVDVLCAKLESSTSINNNNNNIIF